MQFFKFEIAQNSYDLIEVGQADRGLRGAGERHGSTHFLRNGFRHLFYSALVHFDNFFQERQANFELGFGKFGKCAFRRGDGFIHVGGASERNGRDDFLGGRIGDAEIADSDRRDPLPINVELPTIPHGFLSSGP